MCSECFTHKTTRLSLNVLFFSWLYFSVVVTIDFQKGKKKIIEQIMKSILSRKPNRARTKIQGRGSGHLTCTIQKQQMLTLSPLRQMHAGTRVVVSAFPPRR